MLVVGWSTSTGTHDGKKRANDNSAQSQLKVGRAGTIT